MTLSRRGLARQYRQWVARHCPEVPARLDRYPTDEEVIRAILTVPRHWSGPAYVQSRSQQTGSSSSAQTLAFSSNVTAASLAVVAVGSYNSGTATVTVTDNAGGGTNTYTQLDSYRTVGSMRLSVWYFANSPGGACTVTVTPSTSLQLTIAIHEYSGVATTTPLDSASGQTGGSDNNPTTPTVTASSGELVFACYSQATVVATATVAAPFTIRVNENGVTAVGLGTADDTSAAGNEGATFTLSGGQNASWAAMAASFKAGGGGGAATAHLLACLGVGG